MVAGGVGLAAFTLGTVLSLAPIRHRAFEFFLISHIVLMM
jgi:ferric-chelate reductase